MTGIITSSPGATFNQSYYNLIWNCAGQTSNLGFAGNLQTITNNFTVSNTGSAQIRLNSTQSATTTVGGALNISGGVLGINSDNGSGVLTVTGLATISGGTLTNNTATNTGAPIMNFNGGLTISGGTLDLQQSGNSAGSNNGIVNIAGDFNMSSGSITKTGTGTGTAAFNFSKSGIQTFIKTGGTISQPATGPYSFNIKNGATVDFGSNILDGGSGSFTVESGGGIITANTNATGALTTSGANGSIQGTGTRTFNSGGNYTFNGASAQIAGNGLTGANNLTINNSGGLTLSAATAVSGTLTLTSGNLTLGTNNLTLSSANPVAGSPGTSKHIIANSTGVVSCVVANLGSYTFPVGHSASIYNPVAVTNTSGGSQTYTVKTAAISPSQSNALPYMWVINGATGTCNLAFGWNTADATGTLASAPTSGKAFNGTSSWTFQTSSTAAGSGIDYSTSVTGAASSNPLNWTVSVLSAPTTQASAIAFSNITATGMTLGLTRGNGANVAIFVKDASGAITDPSDATTYTASANWNNGSPSGTQLGSSGYYCVYNGNAGSGASVVSLTNLQSGHTYYVQAYEYNGASGSEKYFTATATNNPNNQIAFNAPSITKNESGYTSNLGMVAVGSNSSYQSFTVQGSDLTDDITVTPPTADFKVSKNGTDWSNIVAITSVEAASPYTVYVRYSPSSATGAVSGNITLSTPGGTSVTVAVSGQSIAAEPTTQGTITFGTTTTTSVVVNFTSGDGGNRIVVAKSGSAPTGTPADGTSYTGNAAFGSAPAFGDGVVVYSGAANTVTVTGLTSSETYYFTVYEFGFGTGTSQNYLLTSPGSNNTVLAPIISLSSGSSTQIVKKDVAITPIVYTITGTVNSASCTGLPAGVTFDGVNTISGTPTTSTYQAYPYTVTINGVNGSTATATGTITVQDPNAKKIAVLYTSTTLPAGANKLSAAFNPALYAVTVYDVATNNTAAKMDEIYTIGYDLIILHENVNSANLAALRLGYYIGQVPILNTKSHMYSKTGWPTGAGQNGTAGTNTSVTVNSGFENHPIFSGVTFSGSNVTMAGASGNIRWVTGATTTNQRVIANNSVGTAGSISILEDNVLLTHAKKYMMIALSAAAEDYTTNGILLLKNACDHLMAQSIFASSSSNGTISSVGETDVATNGSKVYTITPNANYHIADVLVDGVSDPTAIGSGSYTFSNVTTYHTISATFAIDTYTVTYDGNGNLGGSVAAPTSADYNASITLAGVGTLTKTGYTFSGWNTAANGSGTSYAGGVSFTIPASNTTLYAQWTINTYAISASTGSNGTVSPSGATDVNFAGSQAYSITPEAGYHVADVLVDGVSNPTAITTGSYTFSNVTTTHTISATFASGYAWTGAVDNSFATGGNWQGGSAPNANAGSDVLVIAGTLPLAGSTVFGNVNVVSGCGLRTNNYVLTVNGTANINGTFQIDEGGWATGTADFVYGSASTLLFNNTGGSYGVASDARYWPYTNGPKNVTVQGVGGITLNAWRSVDGLFQTAAGVTVPGGQKLTINGQLQINSGGYISTNSPEYGAASSLIYNNGIGGYTSSLEWPASNAPFNVEIKNSTPVTLSTSRSIAGTLTLTSGSLNNSSNGLTLGNGANVILTAGTLSATPTFGTSVNLTYNGASVKGNEFPAANIINSLTVNNTAGISLTDNRAIPTLSIGSGSSIGVAAAKQLTVSTTMTNNGTLNLLSDASGTATIITPASIGGSGTANVQQYLTAASRNWYFSSPVSNATGSVVLGTVETPSGNSIWQYNEVNANWNDVMTPSTPLTATRGFIARKATDGTIVFTGTLNSGDITTPTLSRAGATSIGFNLIGNPYASYASWDNATKTKVLTSIWYRSKSTGVYKFQTYNTTGGAGTLGGSELIPPMQAFWVRVDAGQAGDASVTFKQATRSHQDQSVATNRLKTPALAQQVLRLEVSNAVNTDEAIVLFNAAALDGYDAFDSPKMSNNNVAIPEIYTLAGNEQLVINGLTAVTPNKELALGFNTGSANTFTIKATQVSNFDADTKIYLRDNLLNTEQELTVGASYIFSSDVTNTTTRFSLIFKTSAVVNGIQNNPYDYQNIAINTNGNNQITIYHANGERGTVTVCNAIGQKLISTQITGTSTIIGKQFSSGVYLVTVGNEANKVTKKVIIK
ncbi:MAG: InlB B-repeat-containing protein [Paludibacter sp.]